jgi:rifampin ADP-ribosylating transferase
MTYARDATPPFYHGTRADLQVGDLLTPGFASNYQEIPTLLNGSRR